MKKTILMLFLIGSVLSGLAAAGQKDALISSSHIDNFEGIRIDLPAETVIRKADSCSLDIDIPDRLRSAVSVYVDAKNVLIIRARSGTWIRRSDKIRIRIAMPWWSSLELASSGTIRSDESWENPPAQISLTGSGDFFLRELYAPTARIRTNGSGDLRLSRLELEGEGEFQTTGSGNIYVGESLSSALTIHSDGSGDVEGRLETGELKIQLTGSGDLRASGSCRQAELITTGSGDIRGEELFCDEASVKLTGSGDVRLRDGCRLKEIKMTGSGVFRSL